MNNYSKNQRRSGERIPDLKRYNRIDDVIDTDEDRIMFRSNSGNDPKNERRTSQRSSRSYQRNPAGH
jgi:hypothetical protein